MASPRGSAGAMAHRGEGSELGEDTEATKARQDLVRPLIEAVIRALPSFAAGDIVLDPVVVHKNIECLVTVSLTCLPNTLHPLTESLAALVTELNMNLKAGSQAGVSSGGNEDDPLGQSILVLLDTMSRCLALQWDNEGLKATPLPTPLVQLAVAQAYEVLTACRDHSFKMAPTLTEAAGRMVFNLSARNFAPVMDVVTDHLARLAQLQEESPDVGPVSLLEHMHFDRQRLVTLIKSCDMSFRSMKRGTQQAMAPLIRSAVWKWIAVYPEEFVTLQKDGQQLCNSCEALFDLYAGLSEKSNRKAASWPMQLSMLLLCPDIMLGIHSGANDGPAIAGRKLLDSMKKALLTSNKALSDVAVRCYVDICKASTYVSKQTTTCCLRFMVPPIEAELKKRLLDSVNPFFESIGPKEEELLVQFLLACYRLSNKSVITSFMVPFVHSPDAPSVYKSVVIQTLLKLKSEPQLEWNAGVEQAIPLLARPIRRLLHVTMRKIRTQGTATAQAAAKAPRSKRDARLFGGLQQDVCLLQWLLLLLRSEPAFLCHHENGENDAGPAEKEWYPSENCDFTTIDSLTVMTSLVECLEDARLVELTDEATKTLVCLHEPDVIAGWNPNNRLAAFWEVSSNVLIRLALQLVQHKSGNAKHLLACVKRLLYLSNKFITLNKTVAMQGFDPEVHKQTRNQLDVVLLTSLCNPEAEIVRMAAECFKRLCEQADLLLEAAEADPTYDATNLVFLHANENVYRQLWDSGQLITGIRAAQKRVHSVIRGMQVQTGGNLAAWGQLYSQWGLLVDSLVVPPEPGSPARGLPPEFVSTTGMLCALVGVCLMSDLQTTRTLRHVEGAGKPVMNATVRKAQQFIQRLLELLVCNIVDLGVSIRETVKEAVGQEMTPVLYPLLFEAFNASVQSRMYKDAVVVVSQDNTLFLNQVTNTVRLLLNSKIASASEYLALVDLESLVQAFLDYLRQLRRTEQVHVKIDFCNLVSLLMDKKQALSFRQEIQFRNSLVSKLMEFMSTVEQRNIAESIELDMACMKAISSLLAGLPLQPVRDDESADVMIAKSKLFLKYFTFFMNVTNRCQAGAALAGTQRASAGIESIIESEHELQPHASPPGRPRSSDSERIRMDTVRGAPIKRERLLRRIATLRDSCCQAMSNLLSANVDVGLGHSISMGYHSDVGVRHAFTEVLTEVLKQGTEFDSLAETVLSDRYAMVIQLLTEPELKIAHALANTVPSSQLDALSHLLFNLFEAHNALVPLLFRTASWEVDQCLSAQTLFRRNSLATKVGIAFVKLHQQAYLADVLQPTLQAMTDTDNGSYEIDPSRLKSPDAAKENLARLVACVRQLFDAILSSADIMPPQLKTLCFMIRSLSEQHFPEAGLSAVGGFLFLRYLSPAIVSPEAYGLVESMSGHAQRGLLLVSKVVQAVANMAPFSGVKESYMEVMNDFVSESIPKLQTFLALVSEKPFLDVVTVSGCRRFGIALPGVEEFGPCEDPEPYEFSHSDVGALHRFLHEHREKIGREMTLSGGQATSTTASSSSSLFDQLAGLLAQLGDPPKEQVSDRRLSVSAAHSMKDSKFEEFLDLHAFRKTSTETIQSRNMFFQSGKSKANRPVFYYIARRFDVGEVESEEAILHILLTLKPFLRSPYELVVDLTLVNHNHEPSLSVIGRLASLLPAEAMQNLACLHVYNLSTYARGFFKRAQRIVVGSKLHKKIGFVNLKELSEALGEVQLPSSSTTITEHTLEFTGVSRVGTNRKHIPIVLRVGVASVQVCSVERVAVLRTTAVTKDVFDISKISDISLTEEKMVIDYQHGSDAVALVSPDLQAIHRAVHDSWARDRLSKPETSVRKAIRPEDVPGTLLNMALLNLGSPDPSLRLAAYNFLAALTVTFDFNIGGQLLEATGLALPQNNTHFIIRISECLAINEARLTLEFLEECIAGLDGSTIEQKHLCLEYMQPWLPNVKTLAAGAPEKAMNIIEGLVKVTIREKELYPSLQAKVWYTIGRVDDLVERAVDHFLHVAMDSGPGSTAAIIMADAMVTLAAANVRIVARRVLDTIHGVLARTSENPKSLLDEHPLWPELQVLIRFVLMLSFNNRLDLEVNLPDVLHIVTQTLACGAALTRASLHATVINVFQALCTTLSLDAETLRFVRLRLSAMMDPKFALQFGISFKSGQSNPVFSAMLDRDVEGHTVADQFHIEWLQSVVSTAWEIVQSCSSAGVKWGERWVGLAQSTAFVSNTALQPRAFVTLGIITQELPEGLLINVLDALAVALDRLDVVLAEAILVCLTRLIRVVPKGSIFHPAIFWVAFSVLQMGDSSVFPAALEVLEMSLRTLDSHGVFDGVGIAPVLMAARQPVAELCDSVDQRSAVSCKNNFSFAVAAALMTGLSHASPRTVERTTRVLMTFLSVEQRACQVQLNAEMLGYAAVLLPVVHEARASLLPAKSSGSATNGVAGTESDSQAMDEEAARFKPLFAPEVFTEATSVLFLVSVCVMLEHVQHQDDRRFVFGLLAHASHEHYGVLQAFRSLLLPHLSATIVNPPDTETLARCQHLLHTLLKAEGHSASLVDDVCLRQMGFSGLLTACKPNRTEEARAAIANVASAILRKHIDMDRESQSRI
eukprot:m.57787 g.57787  ORF g.57787 m.57787 type:complete len:2607 (+) comp12795_c0_seq1:372-8192(+)